MPQPERSQPPQFSQSSNYRVGPTARILIKQVEDQTGRPVVLREVVPNIHRTYGYIVYATSDHPHTISLIPEMKSAWDYLIAHECSHALRFFAVAKREQLAAAIEPTHRGRAAKILAPTIRERWRASFGIAPRGLPRMQLLINMYVEGLVGQVVNFPPDLRIESWIYRELPDLRQLQRETLRTNIAELQLGLDALARQATPEVIFKPATSLNAAYCAYIARLLDEPGLSRPYKQAGFGDVGDELAEEIWQTAEADYNQDRRDTNRWANRFGVRDWFCWRLYPR